MMLIIILLFTLDIIYSTDASGLKQTNALNEYFKSHLTEESQLPGGKPVGYLQAWSRIWTWDYREQIQLAVRAGRQLGASELQVQRSNRSAMLPLPNI